MLVNYKKEAIFMVRENFPQGLRNYEFLFLILFTIQPIERMVILPTLSDILSTECELTTGNVF